MAKKKKVLTQIEPGDDEWIERVLINFTRSQLRKMEEHYPGVNRSDLIRKLFDRHIEELST